MSLELRQQQKQLLSQRMIQSVQVLQMTAQELEAYVDDLALENPVMDVEKQQGESIDRKYDSIMAVEQEHYLSQRRNNDDDYDPRDSWNFNTEHGETLKEYLSSQIVFHLFNAEESGILGYLMDSLDEKGYLTESAEETARRLRIPAALVEELTEFLQGLEPSGVCAHSLSECLQIQLREKGILNEAMRLLTEDCLDLIAKNKIAAIAGKLGIAADKASQYCALIRGLDPKPGSRFYHQEEISYIIPDVYVTRGKNGFQISLNKDGAPGISVNSYYRQLSSESDDPKVKEYLDKKIRQAEWVRQCIEQRQSTITAIAGEILKKQMMFFEKGPDHLLPLKMTEVAEAAGIHESTVSRAADKKYLQCSWGTFPLSYFFQRKATARDNRAAAQTEENFTSDRIRQAIRDLISSENPKKPYSDRILSEKLTERGITVSRRTVAKYRDEAGIPDASGRKHAQGIT